MPVKRKAMRKIIILVLSIICFYSCISLQGNLKGDYYKIVNKVLSNQLKEQDSIYLITPYSKKELKREMHVEKNPIDYWTIDKNSIHFFKKEANIDIKSELPYFKEQIKKQFNYIDTTKIIKDKRIRYFPWAKNLKDSIKYMNFKYTKYLSPIPQPVFTKNGSYGVMYYHRRGGFYFYIFKKTSKGWIEYAKYLSLRI